MQVTTVPTFGPEKLELILTVAMRNPGLFEAAKEILDAACFRDGEHAYSLAWRAYVEAARKAGSTLSVMAPAVAELQDAARATPDLFPRTWVEPAIAFLMRVDGTPREATMAIDVERVARNELRQFVSERKAIDPLRRALADSRGYMLQDPRAVLEQVNSQLVRADALIAQSAHRLRPDAPLTEAEQIATGVDPIDRATGGGVSPKKVYGIFGPSGAFKTGLAVQLATAAARAESARARAQTGYRPKLVIYAVYEGGRTEIQLRGNACAAEIPKARMKAHLSGIPILTSTQYAQPYERELSLEMPETERMARADLEMEPLRILDMSSSSESPHTGSGYTTELCASIDKVVREEGREVAAVFIDYAKIMARRYAMATGKLEQLVHLLGSLPDLLRISIAERHNTPLWILQQLDAEANKRKPGAVLHHAQSSWAKDIGEYMWYAFCLSSIDKANGNTTVLNASKTRDTEGLPRPYVLQLCGIRQKLVATDEYSFDASQGRIIQTAVGDAFGATSALDDEPAFEVDN